MDLMSVDADDGVARDFARLGDVERGSLQGATSARPKRPFSFCHFAGLWLCVFLLGSAVIAGLTEDDDNGQRDAEVSCGDGAPVNAFARRLRRHGGRGQSRGGWSKAALDNRANQLNPNNWRYWSSRGMAPPWQAAGRDESGPRTQTYDWPERPSPAVVPLWAAGGDEAAAGAPPGAEAAGRRAVYIPRRSGRYAGAYLLELKRCSSRSGWKLQSLRRLDGGGRARRMQGCEGGAAATCSFSGRIREGLLEDWPACYAASEAEHQGLWVREWQTQGSCMGWAPDTYFSTAMRLKAQGEGLCGRAAACQLCLAEELDAVTLMGPDSTCGPAWQELPPAS